MANYSIQRSLLAAGSITVNEAAVNTDTNVSLVGQNFTGYGDEIATNFLQLLENFASDTAPESNARVPGSTAITGQLWYDTSATHLKVYDGTAWDSMAKVNISSVESSTLRWNNTSGRYQPEERIRISDAGVFIIDAASAGTNAVSVSHNGTDLSIAGAGTTDINITGITAMNIPSVTLSTSLDEIYGGTGLTTYATGELLYASGANTLAKLSAGTNGQVLTVVAGLPSWQSGSAGVSALDDLTDVDLTGAADNALLYRSGGDWIDSTGTGLSWDGTTLNATQFNSIVANNLIDRTSPGVISGAATFNEIIAQASGISFGDSVPALFGSGDDVNINFGGTNFVITGPGSGNYRVTGFSEFYVDAVPLIIDNINDELLQLKGNRTSSDVLFTSYLTFMGSDDTAVGQVGHFSGSSNYLTLDGKAEGVRIKGTDNNTKLIATTSLQGWHSGNDAAFITQNPLTAGNTTSLKIYDGRDVTAGGGGYDAGFNGTPAVSITGTYVIDYDDCGKFLRKAGTSAVDVDLPANANIPVGATFLIHNDNATGALTISTVGTTLQWIDGGTSPIPTGTRTLAYNSICTVRKKDGSTWQIWGNGLS